MQSFIEIKYLLREELLKDKINMKKVKYYHSILMNFNQKFNFDELYRECLRNKIRKSYQRIYIVAKTIAKYD